MTEQAKKIAECVAKALDAKKASDIQIIDVAEMTIVAECFVVASGSNPIQVRALSQAAQRRVQRRPLGCLGLRRCTGSHFSSGGTRFLQFGASLERRKQYHPISCLKRSAVLLFYCDDKYSVRASIPCARRSSGS